VALVWTPWRKGADGFPGAGLRLSENSDERTHRPLTGRLGITRRRPKAAPRCCSRPRRTSSAARNSTSCWVASRPRRPHEEGAGPAWRPRRVVRRLAGAWAAMPRSSQPLSAASASSGSAEDASASRPSSRFPAAPRSGPTSSSSSRKTLRG
jgi:hypothetical protein